MNIQANGEFAHSFKMVVNVQLQLKPDASRQKLSHIQHQGISPNAAFTRDRSVQSVQTLNVNCEKLKESYLDGTDTE